MLSKASQTADGPTLAMLEEVEKAANDLVAQVRNLSLDLRPAMLDDLGLLPALLWLVQNYSGRTGIQIDMRHAGLERTLPADISTAAYRIVQEALTNVARHSQTKEVSVRVWAAMDMLFVQVQDKGKGFVLNDVPLTSSGLRGMRERVTALGAS